MTRYVEIAFDCLPLRSIGRLDIPIDASPKFRQRCERIKAALKKHGSHNSFYLYNASCTYHLTNQPDYGMLEFKFEGTVLTDEADRKSIEAYLDTELVRETCDWLTEPIVRWFADAVSKSVMVEFDRYIAVGDLEQTIERVKKLQAQNETSGGYVGMYL